MKLLLRAALFYFRIRWWWIHQRSQFRLYAAVLVYAKTDKSMNDSWADSETYVNWSTVSYELIKSRSLPIHDHDFSSRVILRHGDELFSCPSVANLWRRPSITLLRYTLMLIHASWAVAISIPTNTECECFDTEVTFVTWNVDVF